MTITDLATQPHAIRQQATTLLVEGFDRPTGWPDLETASHEIGNVLHRGFAFAALENDLLLGWIGGLPEYDGRVWELHPLVVRPDRRLHGVGRALVAAFEEEARRRGALTLTLGTDDDSGQTSLTGVDLYSDIPKHIATLRDLGDRHPFLFYLRLGCAALGDLALEAGEELAADGAVLVEEERGGRVGLRGHGWIRNVSGRSRSMLFWQRPDAVGHYKSL